MPGEYRTGWQTPQHRALGFTALFLLIMGSAFSVLEDRSGKGNSNAVQNNRKSDRTMFAEPVLKNDITGIIRSAGNLCMFLSTLHLRLAISCFPTVIRSGRYIHNSFTRFFYISADSADTQRHFIKRRKRLFYLPQPAGQYFR